MSHTLELTAIPHRDPFLLVDEIVSVEERHIVTRRYVDPDAPYFAGHYPGRPVLPGVFICESCFQSGALLIAHRAGPFKAAGDGVPVLTRIQDARFRRIVSPGETLEIDITLDDELDGAYYMTGRVKVGDEAVLRVNFACMMAQ